MKQKKEMEYEMAPSGFVTLYNYKEPFMEFKGSYGCEGFGYEGVLLFDGETDKVQCHFCGQWFTALGNHLHREHAMTASDYKQVVGLNKKTALIGEKMREKLIAKGLEKRMSNLVSRKGKKITEETKEKIRNTLKENRRENQNIHGTCPLQLIDRLKKIYYSHGYLPSHRDNKEVDNLRPTIVKTYGSMREACAVAGIPYRKPGQNITKEWNKNKLLGVFVSFYEENGKYPTRYVDFSKKGTWGAWKYIKKNKLSVKKLIGEASVLVNDFKAGDRKYLSKDDLIKHLQNFEKVNGRRPSISDGKRKLIPSLSRYYYHFGSWKNALKLAFN